MKTKFLFIILAVFVSTYCAHAAINATSFMKEAAAKITSSKAVTASFKIESAGQQTVTGDIAVQGNKFAVTTSVNSTVYDGSTQWTISNADKEISIFEPTADEIAQVNPFAIIKSYNRDYTVKLISSSGKTVKIQLLPKEKNSTIKKILITFDSSTKLPELMTITLDDGTVLHVTINDIKTDANIQASRFVVSLKNYPGYEVIDLR